jgi:hypothetical protein
MGLSGVLISQQCHCTRRQANEGPGAAFDVLGAGEHESFDVPTIIAAMRSEGSDANG